MVARIIDVSPVGLGEANDRAKNTDSLETTPWIWHSPPKNRSSARRFAPGSRKTFPRKSRTRCTTRCELTRDDLQRWAKILGKKGWLGYGWPKEFGGPGWTAVQKHLFEEETALAGAPRIIPFGPVMVAPVIQAFGNAEQQKRFLPGIASGEVWWSQGYSEPGSGSDLASVKTKARTQG